MTNQQRTHFLNWKPMNKCNWPQTESILDEIHCTRRGISERFHGDIAAIAEDAVRRQAASGRPLRKPQQDKPIDELRAQSCR